MGVPACVEEVVGVPVYVEDVVGVSVYVVEVVGAPAYVLGFVEELVLAVLVEGEQPCAALLASLLVDVVLLVVAELASLKQLNKSSYMQDTTIYVNKSDGNIA